MEGLKATDNLRKLHDNLSKKDGFNVPYEQFEMDMQDTAKLKRLHENLMKKDGFNVPYENFQSDMFTTQSVEQAQPNGILPLNEVSPPVQDPNRVNIPSTTEPIDPYQQKYGMYGGGVDLSKKPQTKSGYNELGTEIGKRAQKSGWTFNQYLADTPDYVNRLLVEAYNISPVGQAVQGVGKIAESLGLTKTAENWKMKAADLRNTNATEYIDNQKKILTDEIAKINPKYEMDIIEAAKQGDWVTFNRNLAGGVADSFIPSLAMMLTGGSMGTAGMIGTGTALFGAGKYAEMDKAAPNMDEGTKVLASAANGALEGIFETFLGSGAVGSAIRKIVSTNGRKTAQEVLSKGIKQGFVDLLIKHPALAPLGEGFEEMGTQISQNYVDIVSGYKPDLKIMDGVLSSGVIGAFSGAVHSAPIYAAKAAFGGNQQQPGQPIPPAAPEVPLTPRQEFENTERQNIDKIKHSDGTVKSVKFDDKEWFVKDTDDNGELSSFLVYDLDENGNVQYTQNEQGEEVPLTRAISKKLIAGDPFVVDPEEMVNTRLQQFDQQEQVKEAVKTNTIPFNGKQTIKVIDDEDGNTYYQEVDSEGNLIGTEEFAPKEEYDKAIELFQAEQAKQQEKVSETPGQTETAPEKPKTRNLTTQNFGGTAIDIAEDEGFDEVIPTEKMPLEKALPKLEAKFKDNKKFKLEVEKVQEEVPGETKYDDPTYKTIIKSIKIVPKVKTEQNETKPGTGIPDNTGTQATNESNAKANIVTGQNKPAEAPKDNFVDFELQQKQKRKEIEDEIVKYGLVVKNYGGGTIAIEKDGQTIATATNTSNALKNAKQLRPELFNTPQNEKEQEGNGNVGQVGAGDNVNGNDVPLPAGNVADGVVAVDEVGKEQVRNDVQQELEDKKEDTISHHMAADYLLTGGIGVIGSSDYLLRGISGAFLKANQSIDSIRKKYFNEINDSGFANVKDFINSDLYTKIMSEIKESINQSYNDTEAQNIFNQILQNPTGLPVKLGNEISIKLDGLNEVTPTNEQNIPNQGTAPENKVQEQPKEALQEPAKEQAIPEPESKAVGIDGVKTPEQLPEAGKMVEPENKIKEGNEKEFSTPLLPRTNENYSLKEIGDGSLSSLKINIDGVEFTFSGNKDGTVNIDRVFIAEENRGKNLLTNAIAKVAEKADKENIELNSQIMPDDNLNITYDKLYNSFGKNGFKATEMDGEVYRNDLVRKPNKQSKTPVTPTQAAKITPQEILTPETVTPEQKVNRINRLLDLAKDYDTIPNSHSVKKTAAGNGLRNLANQIGYSLGFDPITRKAIIYDEKKNPVTKRIEVKQQQDEINSHKVLTDYPADLQENMKWFFENVNRLNEVVLYTTGNKTKSNTKSIQNAITHILNGKNTVLSNRLLDDLEDIIKSGTIQFTNGQVVSVEAYMGLLETEEDALWETIVDKYIGIENDIEAINELFLEYENENTDNEAVAKPEDNGDSRENGEKPVDDNAGNEEENNSIPDEQPAADRAKQLRDKLSSQEKELTKAQTAYSNASTKHSRLAEKLKSDEFGNRGQADIFGNNGAQRAGILDFGNANDEIAAARQAVSDAKKEVERLGQEVNRIAKSIEKTKDEIRNQQEIKFEEPVKKPEPVEAKPKPFLDDKLEEVKKEKEAEKEKTPLEKLQQKLSDLEDKLYDVKVANNEKLRNNPRAGAGYRSMIDSTTKREDAIKERIEKVKEQIEKLKSVQSTPTPEVKPKEAWEMTREEFEKSSPKNITLKRITFNKFTDKYEQQDYEITFSLTRDGRYKLTDKNSMYGTTIENKSKVHKLLVEQAKLSGKEIPDNIKAEYSELFEQKTQPKTYKIKKVGSFKFVDYDQTLLDESAALKESWRKELENGVSDKSRAIQQKLFDFNKKHFAVKIKKEQPTNLLGVEEGNPYGVIDFSDVSGYTDSSVFQTIENGKYIPNELGKKIKIRYSLGGGSALFNFDYTDENVELVKNALSKSGYNTVDLDKSLDKEKPVSEVKKEETPGEVQSPEKAEEKPIENAAEEITTENEHEIINEAEQQPEEAETEENDVLEDNEGGETLDKLQDFGEKIGAARKDIANRGYKLSPSNIPGWAKKYTISQSTQTNLWSISLPQGTWFRKLKDGFKTSEEAWEALPLVAVSQNHRVYSDKDNKFGIYRKWSSGKQWEIKGGFETRDEAMKYMAENAIDIINKRSPVVERPHLDKISRKRKDWRNGRNVTPEQFLEKFGFRGGEFGNWLAADERQQVLNMAYDAFMDMSEILGISPRALSLKGELSIGFGSRGHGLQGAAAHYEPTRTVINLTRINGAGSLAHEWFHALDNYLAKLDGKSSSVRQPDGTFKQEDRKYAYFSHGESTYPKTKVRDELLQAFKAVMNEINTREVVKDYDIPRIEKQLESSKADFEERIAEIRDKGYRAITRTREYGQKKKPATPEQLKKFDELVDKIRSGDIGADKWHSSAKSRMKGKWMYDTEKEISDLVIEITGKAPTAGYGSDNTGFLYSAINRMKRNELELSKAKEEGKYNTRIKSMFMNEAVDADKSRSGAYWSTPHELSARAFESFLEDETLRTGESQYLVYGARNIFYTLFGIKPYPEGQERININNTFRKLFDTIQEKTEGDNQILYMKRNPIGFYSTVENALTYIKQDKGTPEQFKAMLLKNGAKQAELDWMGWDDHFEGKLAKVIKADIQEWIEQNRIEVEGVVKGVRNKVTKKEALNAFNEGVEVYGITEDGFFKKIKYEKDLSNFQKWMIDGLNLALVDTKYSKYQEPGGENYREVLLTMPNKGREVKKGDAERLEILRNKRDELLSRGESIRDVDSQIQILSTRFSEGNGFRSSHFDEPNILAHVRFQEFNTPTEKILMVEEFQSDIAEKIRQLQKKLEAGTISESEKAELDRLLKITPFSKTDQWVNLSLRRMMRYAAENGFDRIAWTNGEQQAARYDLSKQVEYIGYWKSNSSDNEYQLQIKPIGQPETARLLKESELEGFVGKEMAQKIINGEGEKTGNTISYGKNATQRVIEGEGLKIGGEGMKTFYDAIVPGSASKLAKPFGAKVEPIEINFGNDINNETGDYIPDNRKTVQSIPITESMKESVLEGIPLFMDGTKPTTLTEKLTAAELKQHFLKFFEHARNTGNVHVVKNISEIPESVSRMVDVKDTAAFYDPKTKETWFVLDKIVNADEAFKAWVHEVGTHHGLRNIIPPAMFKPLMEKIYNDIGRKAIQAAIPKAYWNEPINVQAEEYLAYLAPQVVSQADLTPQERSIWKQIVEAVKNVLNKLFSGARFTNKEAEEIIKAAVQSVYQRPSEQNKGKRFLDDILGMTDIWHGSPHAFDKFSTSFMGTGEGAQAYGWGLYFTDKESIAKDYATKLSEHSIYINGKEVDSLKGTPLYNISLFIFGQNNLAGNQSKINAIANLNQAIRDRRIDYNDGKKAIDYLNSLDSFEVKKDRRNLYRVKIHGDKTIEELNFLRWDKPINKEQLNKLQEQLKKENLTEKFNDAIVGDVNTVNGQIIYEALSDMNYNTQSDKANNKEASLFLLRAGIDGIQYPSEYTTKGQHDNSFNYVVFDENAVEIDDHIRFAVVGERGAANIENSVNLQDNITEYENNLYEAGQQYLPTKRNRPGTGSEIQEDYKGLENWTEEQFPKYASKIRSALNRHFNNNEYLSAEEVDDIAFGISELIKTGTQYLTQRDINAARALLERRGYYQMADNKSLTDSLKDHYYDLVKGKIRYNPIVEESIAEYNSGEPSILRMVATPKKGLGEAIENANIKYRQSKERKETFKEVVYQIRQNLQDNALPIRKFVENVKELGGTVKERMNVYNAYFRAFGRAEELHKQFTEQKWTPVVKAVAALQKSGVYGEYIVPYLIAKHGPERNLYMREQALQEWIQIEEQKKGAKPSDIEIEEKRAELSVKDYSGISGFDPEWKDNYDTMEEMAETITKDFESIADPQLVKDLHDALAVANKEVLDQWLAGRQITQKEYDDYKKRFKYFIPLRGWEDDAAKRFRYNKSSGFGRSLKHAQGRTSFAENPLANMQSVAFKAIGERVDNEVKESLLSLIVNNYETKFKSLYKIHKAYYRRGIDENGEVIYDVTKIKPTKEQLDSGEYTYEFHPQYMRLRTPANAMEHEVLVRKQGGDILIVFENNPEVAQAINHQNTMFKFHGEMVDAKSLNIVTKVFTWATNWIKAINTSYNPVFPLTNFARDVQEATAHIAISMGLDIGKDIPKLVPRAMKTAARRIYGKSTGTADDNLLQRFYELGAATGWTHGKSIEELQKELDNELKDLLKKGTIKGATKQAWNGLLNGIQSWNQIFEDTTRFAVFMAVREAEIKKGESVQDAELAAATAAKEASLNFNRKGRITKFLDAIWAFFNPAVQGMQKNFALARRYPKRFWGAAGSMMVFGFIEAMLNDMGDGDDDKYYDINEWSRRNYIVIRTGEKFVRIPLPQFWRGFHSMGVIAYDMLTSRTKAGKAAFDVTTNFIGGLSPIDIPGLFPNGEFNISPLAPSAVKPFIDLAYNKNYFQDQIYKEPYTKGVEKFKASSVMYDKNVNPIIKGATEFLAKNVGGRYGESKNSMRLSWMGDFSPLDWNPSKIEYLIQQYTGGIGRIANDITKVAMAATMDEEDVKLNNIPFANSFVRTIPEGKWNVVNQYREYNNDNQEFSDELKEAKRLKDLNKLLELTADEKNKQIYGILNSTNKAMDKIIDAYGYEDEKWSDERIKMMNNAIAKIDSIEQEYKNRKQ